MMADTGSASTQEVDCTVLFGQFRRLPIELRYKIFKLGLPYGRTIEVFFNPKTNQFVTDAKAPALLHVNKESRHEALTVYSLIDMQIPTSDDTDISDWSDPDDVPPEKRDQIAKFKTYIHWATDTISMSPNHFQATFHTITPERFIDFYEEFTHDTTVQIKLKHLSIEAKTFDPDFSAALIAQLHGLESLKLIVGDKCCKQYIAPGPRLMCVDHRKAKDFEELEEPEENMNLKDRNMVTQLGRDNVFEGADMRLAFHLAEQLSKRLVTSLERLAVEELEAPEDEQSGMRVDWEDLYVEPMGVTRYERDS